MRRAFVVLFAPLTLAAKPKAAVAPPPPEPDVRLALDAPDAAGPWTLTLENHADVPVRVRADARLLRVVVDPPPAPEPDADAPADGKRAGAKAKARKKPAAPKPVVCALPADMRPANDDVTRDLELAPGARWAEAVDPRLYCFDERARAALAQGGALVAHLGWEPPKARAGAKRAAPRGPFVAAAAGDDATAWSKLSEVVAPKVELAATPAAEVADGAADAGPAARLAVVGPGRVDAETGRRVTITVTAKNVSDAPLVASLRRDRLAFDVDGPTGHARCAMPPARRGLSRDLFTTLARGASRSFDVWLHEVCPRKTFDRLGLYAVTPSITASDAGDRFGLAGWTGTAARTAPVIVRVHTGSKPFYAAPPAAAKAP